MSMVNNNYIYDIVLKVKGCEEGTGFLINENLILTAWHVVKEKEIVEVEYYSNDTFIWSEKCVVIDISQEDDIALLKLNNAIKNKRPFCKLNLCLPQKLSDWETVGYPINSVPESKKIQFYIIGKVYEQRSSDVLEYDIDLTSEFIKQEWKHTFGGLSGAPIIINETIRGIIIKEEYSNLHTPLKGVSINKIRDFLDRNGIEVQKIEEKQQPNLEELYKTLIKHLDNGNLVGGNTVPNTAAGVFEESINREKTEGKLTCDRIFELAEQEIDRLINEGNLNDAKEKVSDILNSDESCLYGEKFLETLLAKLGAVYIKIEDNIGVEKCLKRLSEIENKGINAYDFMIMAAYVIKNEELLNDGLNGLKKLAVDDKRIRLSNLKYKLFVNNEKDIIDQLFVGGDVCEEYKDDAKAIELVALAFMQMGDYRNSLYFLERTLSIKHNEYNKYLINVCKIKLIFSSFKSIFDVSDENKKSLEDIYHTLVSMENIHTETGIIQKSNYWYNRLLVLLAIDRELMIKEYEKLDVTMKQLFEIRILYADYILLKNDDRAIEEYKTIFREYRELKALIKILEILTVKKMYIEIVEMVETLNDFQVDSGGLVYCFYINALAEVQGYDIALNKALEIYSITGSAFYLSERIAEMYFEGKNVEKTREYLLKMIKSIPKEDYFPRIEMAHTCYRLGHRDLAMETIEPLAPFAIEAYKHLIEYLMIGSNEEKAKAQNCIEDIIKANKADYDIYAMKAHIEMKNEDYKEALATYNKMFTLKREPKDIYNICAIRFNLGDYECNDEVFRCLLLQNTPYSCILISGIYQKNGRDDLKDFYSYKALLLQGENFDEEVYEQFIRLHLLVNGKDDTTVNFEIVTKNQAIELENIKDKSLLRICIHEEKDLLDGDTVVFGRFQHYNITSKIGITLKHRRKFDVVKIDGTDYKILSILDRKAMFIRYCMEMYDNKCPNSKFIQSVPIPQENPTSTLIPYLEQTRKRTEFLLGEYNFSNKLGLSLFSFSNCSYERYLDSIYFLLNKEKQTFFSGEPIQIDDNSVVILSLSSLLMLNISGILDKVKHCNISIHITEGLQKTIVRLFENLENTDLRVSGSIGLDENGKLRYSEVTEKDKEQRLNFWRTLRLFIEDEVNVIKVSYSSNEEEVRPIKEFIGEVELESIFLAKELDAILISDDLFVSRTSTYLNPLSKCSNFISLVCKMDLGIMELLEIFNKLSKAEFFYIISPNITIYLIDKLAGIEIIYGENTPIYYFRNIIRNQFSNLGIFREVIKKLPWTVDYLYNNKTNQAYTECMSIILEELNEVNQKYKIPRHQLIQLLSSANIDGASEKQEYYSKYIK